MDTSGRPHEGWMTVVPLSVFILVVMAALGGPTAVVNFTTVWIGDIVNSVVHFFKYL